MSLKTTSFIMILKFQTYSFVLAWEDLNVLESLEYCNVYHCAHFYVTQKLAFPFTINASFAKANASSILHSI